MRIFVWKAEFYFISLARQWDGD